MSCHRRILSFEHAAEMIECIPEAAIEPTFTGPGKDPWGNPCVVVQWRSPYRAVEVNYSTRGMFSIIRREDGGAPNVFPVARPRDIRDKLRQAIEWLDHRHGEVPLG